MQKLIKRLSIIVLLWLCLVGCNSKPTMVVLTSADSPPFSFIEKGKFVGFDIDLITAVANKLNYQVQIKDVDFIEMLSEIQHSNATAAIGAITITAKRKQMMDFSVRYYNGAKFVILYKPKPIPPRTIDDLNNKRIGTVEGTTFQDFLITYNNDQRNWIIITYKNIVSMVKALQEEELDAIVWEHPLAEDIAKQNGFNYSILHEDNIPSSYGIALPKGSFLTTNFSNALIEMQISGELDALSKKWRLT